MSYNRLPGHRMFQAEQVLAYQRSLQRQRSSREGVQPISWHLECRLPSTADTAQTQNSARCFFSLRKQVLQQRREEMAREAVRGEPYSQAAQGTSRLLELSRHLRTSLTKKRKAAGAGGCEAGLENWDEETVCKQGIQPCSSKGKT